MTKRPLATGLGLGLAVGLAGCSAFYQDFKATQQGWRTAEVLEVGPASEIHQVGLTDCRQSVTAQQLAQGRFAAVLHRVAGGGRYVRHTRHIHILAIDDASPVKAGDVVHANVVRCGLPIEVHTTAIN